MKNIEIVLSDDGCVRFKENKIVSYLLSRTLEDMNTLALLDFSDEDRMVFAQLIGYSVSGYGDLSYASNKSVRQADGESYRIMKKANK